MKNIRLWLLFLAMALVVGFLSAPPAHAAGQQGWNYQWWDCCGSGSWVSYNPFNNQNGANSAQMYAYGYIKWPGTATQSSGARTINFGTGWDDNGWLKINGTVVAAYNCCYTAYGSYTANIGDVVKVELYSNNTGGWTWGFQALWDPQMDGSYQYLDGSAVATDSTFWGPILCCGGSSNPFTAKVTNTNKINSFVTRTTADSRINVEQIGNFNVITIDQIGTKNNAVNYYVNGSNNTTTITQSGNASTQTNMADISITGNSNTTTVSQTSTGGTKGAFVSISNNNNNVKIQQTDSGSHYADVTVSGGNKSVDITQSGTANHMASITLTGQAQGLTLQQTGATQQFYSISTNCATAGGCAAITVKQGN